MAFVVRKEYPPFPSDVPIAQLSRISLKKLLSDDEPESEALYKSCKVSGFFLLDLTATPEGEEILRDVTEAFEMAETLFGMGSKEKMKFSLRPGKAYGYKAQGVSKIDDKGTPDRCEFWGLSKDEMIGDKRLPTPEVVAAHHDLLERLIRRAHAICLLILSKIEGHLGLETGKLASLHRFEQASADQLRLLKMSPQPEDDRRTSLLAHTDFGSVTLLWNILGGLQILPPGNDRDMDTSEAWEYVQPQSGCAVVNMGDAMVDFSDGVIRSNLHRVGYAPGLQGLLDRYSIAYFARPEDEVVMEGQGLKGIESRQRRGLVPKLTASEWAAMKSEMYQKGLGVMKSSGGTTTVGV